MMKECTEFFGSTVRYCTIISSYDTDITYFDIVNKNSDQFRLNRFSLQFPPCERIKYNFRAISKNVNNKTQSEKIMQGRVTEKKNRVKKK